MFDRFSILFWEWQKRISIATFSRAYQRFGNNYSYLIKSLTGTFEHDVPLEVVVIVFQTNRASDLIVLLYLYKKFKQNDLEFTFELFAENLNSVVFRFHYFD